MIDLTLERPGDHHFVRSVGESGIRVGDTIYTGPLILTPRQVMTGWPPATFAEIRAAHLEALFALDPEVALLGTGARQAFLAPDIMIEVYRRGIGLEVMTTDAACRTFNILASDGRHVVAALLPMRAP